MVDFHTTPYSSSRSPSSSGSQRSTSSGGGGSRPAPRRSAPRQDEEELLSARSVITGQQYGSVEERKAADMQARAAAQEARARGQAPAQPTSQGKYVSSVKGSVRSSEAEALTQQAKQERAAGNQQNAAMLERRAAEAMQRAANRQYAEREAILRKPTATGQAVPGQGRMQSREIPFQTVEGQTQSRMEASRFKQVIVASPGFAGKAATIPGLEVKSNQNVLVQTEEGYRPGGSVTTVGVRDPLIFTEDEQNVVQRDHVLRGDHTPQINESAREYIPIPGRDYSPVAGLFSPAVLPASVLASPSFTGFVGKNIFVAPFGSGQEKQVVEHGSVLQLEEKPGLAFDEKGLHHALLYNYAPLDKDYKTWSQKLIEKGNKIPGLKGSVLTFLSAPVGLVEPFVHTAVSPFRALVKPTPYSVFQQKIEQDKSEKPAEQIRKGMIDVHRESGVLSSIKNYWKNLKFQTEYHQYEQLEKAKALPRTPAQQKTDQARREQITKEFKETFGKDIAKVYPEVKKSYETQRVKDIGYTSETEAQFGQEAALTTAAITTGPILLKGAGSLAAKALPSKIAQSGITKTLANAGLLTGVEAPQVYAESKEYDLQTALTRSAGRIATYGLAFKTYETGKRIKITEPTGPSMYSMKLGKGIEGGEGVGYPEYFAWANKKGEPIFAIGRWKQLSSLEGFEATSNARPFIQPRSLVREPVLSLPGRPNNLLEYNPYELRRTEFGVQWFKKGEPNPFFEIIKHPEPKVMERPIKTVNKVSQEAKQPRVPEIETESGQVLLMEKPLQKTNLERVQQERLARVRREQAMQEKSRLAREKAAQAQRKKLMQGPKQETLQQTLQTQKQSALQKPKSLQESLAKTHPFKSWSVLGQVPKQKSLQVAKQALKQVPMQASKQVPKQALKQVPKQVPKQTPVQRTNQILKRQQQFQKSVLQRAQQSTKQEATQRIDTYQKQISENILVPPVIPSIPGGAGGFGRQPGLGPKSPYRGERTYKVPTPKQFSALLTKNRYAIRRSGKRKLF